jgi:hypothetical protein
MDPTFVSRKPARALALTAGVLQILASITAHAGPGAPAGTINTEPMVIRGNIDGAQPEINAGGAFSYFESNTK